MGTYGRKAFVEMLSTYTSLTASDATKLLETDIIFDHVDSVPSVRNNFMVKMWKLRPKHFLIDIHEESIVIFQFRKLHW